MIVHNTCVAKGVINAKTNSINAIHYNAEPSFDKASPVAVITPSHHLGD